MSNVLDNNPEYIRAQEDINAAWLNLAEKIAAAQELAYELLYEDAFNKGIAHVKAEFMKVAADVRDEPAPVPVKTGSLTEKELITDQSVYAYVVNNPGWRTTDLIAKALELPLKPALTENDVKATVNRLKRDGKIDVKSGRWYSTQAKPSRQQFQVMTYMPDGSKYLGSDVINEKPVS